MISRIAGTLVLIYLVMGFGGYEAKAQGLASVNTKVVVEPIRKDASQYGLSITLSWQEEARVNFALIQVTYPDGTRFQSGQIPIPSGGHSTRYTFNQATTSLGRSVIDFTLVEGGTLYKGRTFSQTVQKTANQDYVTAWDDKLVLQFFPTESEFFLSVTPSKVLALSDGVGENVPQNSDLGEVWQEIGDYFEIHTEPGNQSVDQILAYFRIPDNARGGVDYRVQEIAEPTFPRNSYLGETQGDYYVVPLFGLSGGYSLVGKVGMQTPPTFSSAGRITSSLDKGAVGGRKVAISYFGFRSCSPGVEPQFSSETVSDEDGQWALTNGRVGWIELVLLETALDPPTEMLRSCVLANTERLSWDLSLLVHTKPYTKLLVPNERVVVGQEFELGIQVNTLGYQGLNQAHLEMNFDPAKIEFLNVVTDYGVVDFGEDRAFINQTGKIFLVTTLLPQTGEDFVPARLLFRSRHSGTTTVDLVRTVVTDSGILYETTNQRVVLDMT